jgi:hypothetical protein
MITIEKIEDRDGRISFQDKETKAQYVRVIGGLGWPGIKPGFAVVIGEDFEEDPSLKIRHLRVFSEIEEENFERLFQKCLEARDRYQVEDYYGNTENKPMMEFLRDFNRELEDGVFQLSLGLAPFPEDLAYHAWVIRERIEQGEKSLYLPENSLLKGYLMELGKEQVQKANILDYPAVAGLGYVLSHIKTYPFVRPKPYRREHRQSSWRTI